MLVNKNVSIWEDEIIIPTYKVYPPEKSPMFLEKRAYQGSTGKVYPLPVSEKISTEKEDVKYKVIYLENKYIKVMIMPELGGRIQRATDKTNNYDFVYYNNVIKPALVGLTGPWISGGIEFNWPQHHRPSTFLPVEYTIAENSDGSCTVFLSEIDKMYGTKGMAKISIYPDKSYIEIEGQLYNRTDTPQTFLWWANPAVPANDFTYSVFPPDVNSVMDHGKRAVSTFPIATGEYYKYDYSAGIDISKYKNIKVPTSYMAAKSEFDFIGNYDENLEAGIMHVADHHISPGKKQWTWGNSDFGIAWDRNLTDEDGPYVELMTGVYTDNQPDFTWLKPYEEKTFVQYFMPYKNVGRAKNATRDAIINFELENKKATVKIYSTGIFEKAELIVNNNGSNIYKEIIDLCPEEKSEIIFNTDIEKDENFEILVLSNNGNVLVKYDSYVKELEKTAEPAEIILEPIKLKSTEELFLAASHLEQYRHATYEPADYYEEGLRRDPTDIRLNNGYGMLLLKRGHFGKAKSHFKEAIKKQTWKNPNPYNGECYFNLGLVSDLLGDEKEAIDSFYKSTWSYETQSSGFYRLALISSRNKKYSEALEFLNKSIIRNWHNMKARGLKVSILRKLHLENESLIKENLEIDRLDFGSIFEDGIRKNDLSDFRRIMNSSSKNFLELSLDYIKAGFYDDAITILENSNTKDPLVYYYIGYAYKKKNEPDIAIEFFKLAENTPYEYCFPNKIEEILILETAIELLNTSSFAHFYLGNLLYDKKQYTKAFENWQKSSELNPNFAMVFRNLAIYFYNKENNIEKSLVLMKKAFELESDYSRFLLEYDQLCGIANIDFAKRLSLLDHNLDSVQSRDALLVEYITQLNNAGQYEKAYGYIMNHKFSVWEGGEGKISNQYKTSLTQMALKEIDNGSYEKAIEYLNKTFSYPENLGEGKLPNVQDNVANYYLGKIYYLMGNKEKSNEYFLKASKGLDKPSVALYYHDQPSDTIFYQGLAEEALGNIDESRKYYNKLISFAEKQLFAEIKYDYFAVSLPEIDIFPTDIEKRNTIYCKYLMALGFLGMKEKLKAKKLFDEILELKKDHQGAILHKEFLY